MIDPISKREANDAMINQLSVRFRGKVYKRINAITARRWFGSDERTAGEVTDGDYMTVITVSLYDADSDSEVIAPIKECYPCW